MNEADAQKLQAIRYWFVMAHECLASARREADADALPFAMNRLYYAAFYAVSAVLLELGVSFENLRNTPQCVQPCTVI